MTRLFEKRKSDDIVRRCKYCSITDNELPFLVQKNYKNGKMYKHCVCKPCFEDNMSMCRIKYYNKNREKQIADARKWNVENREKYNARRRKTEIEKWNS